MKRLTRTRPRPTIRCEPAYVGYTSRILLVPDKTNPRKADAARTGLLAISLAKLGFVMPLFVDSNSGLLLSGHQRLGVAEKLGIDQIPTVYVSIAEKDIKGVNIVFNRATNDFGAFDTGSAAKERLDLDTVLAEAEALPDNPKDKHFAINCKDEPLAPLVKDIPEKYDQKAASMALVPQRMGIKIPVVVSESGVIVNGIHRAFAALKSGETHWPVIRIPDTHAKVALNFLNYLSMDFHVDGDFQKMLRASAYRRPQNNRGAVPKAMRFWANGERTLPDKDSYSADYWRTFRDMHGQNILDFGAGLGKAAPYLQTKGINAIDFEPYRIDPEGETGVPSPDYSRQQAKRFLKQIEDPNFKLDSIFLCSVLNSVPFPRDRMCVLAIVHALSSKSTITYGTCRDISDYNYEYGGIRNANYFTFDSEPGVRIGDFMGNPKIQKFHSQDEAKVMFDKLWKTTDFWPGGNVFYFRLKNPMAVNAKVLGAALDFEFGELPFKDGTTMGLAKEARKAFSKRLGITL